MAQWDVFVNPSARLRDQIPFLVDLQSDLLSSLETRFVAPLARTRVAFGGLPRRMCPEFSIDGERVVLLPQEAAALDARLLKRHVGSLRAHAREVTDALDAVISDI